MPDAVSCDGAPRYSRFIIFWPAASITPYAASGIDEYFAEGVRSWVVCNDAASHWPTATNARLRRVDPALFAIVKLIFEGFD